MVGVLCPGAAVITVIIVPHLEQTIETFEPFTISECILIIKVQFLWHQVNLIFDLGEWMNLHSSYRCGLCVIFCHQGMSASTVCHLQTGWLPGRISVSPWDPGNSSRFTEVLFPIQGIFFWRFGHFCWPFVMSEKHKQKYVNHAVIG